MKRDYGLEVDNGERVWLLKEDLRCDVKGVEHGP